MTKINIRSPYYLNYSEPALPSVALDCTLINLRGLQIDQFGNVTLPTSDYGVIKSYTSTDIDFADGKFSTVVSSTSRTITFTISIPSNFSNSGNETIDCSDTVTQPAYVCTGGVTLNGSIPSQSLDTGGDSVSIDLSSYFTAGADPISSYSVTNSYTTFVSTSIGYNTLNIYSLNKTGVINIFVEASDGNPLTCNATQSISITLSANVTYDCNYAYLTGGGISNTGVITNPSVNGTITAVKDTSGGTTITSYPANNTGSARSVTLYFDITVPTGVGYTNGGATVECFKTFTQSSTSLPEFTCEVATLTNQAIAENGTIKVGQTNVGTIASFSPLSFSSVSVDTQRTVTFQITPPASGYANSGGSNISCPVTMIQPSSAQPTTGNKLWYYSYNHWEFGGDFAFLTIDQFNQAYPNGIAGGGNIPNFDNRVLEYILNSGSRTILPPMFVLYLVSDNIADNVGTYASGLPLGQPILFPLLSDQINPTGGFYIMVSKMQFPRNLTLDQIDEAAGGVTYWVKIETTGLITEVWAINLMEVTFQRLA